MSPEEFIVDKDVRARYLKLCDQYQMAMTRIELLRPTKAPTNRQRYQLETQVTKILREVRDTRGPVVGSLVKLAYVRAYRELVPGGAISGESVSEIRAFEEILSAKLAKVESKEIRRFSEHIRRLSLADRMESSGIPSVLLDAVRNRDGQPLLEQHARAEIAYVVDMARAAATLAATPSGDYDMGAEAA